MPNPHDDIGFEAGGGDDLGFAPSPKRIPPTVTESALRGAMQGATFGFGDELVGAAKSANDVLFGTKKMKELPESYRQHRDVSRAYNEAAREVNPNAYTAGEVAGGIGTAFIPGLGLLKGGTALKAIGQGAAIGGLQGLGTSNADLTKGDIGNAAEDVVGGATVGGALGGVAHGAIGAIKGLTAEKVGKKMANVFLSTPEEVTETYIRNPQKVMAAPKRFEVAQNYENALDQLQNEVKSGSQQSRQILTNEGTKFNRGDIASIFENKAKELADRSEGIWDNPEQKSAYNWLKNTAEQYRAQGAEAPAEVSANRVKDLLQGIDRSTQFESAPGTFSNIDDLIKKDVRGKVDTMLKDKSPAYQEQMKQVASDTGLLNDARDVAKSPQGLTSAFRRVENDQYGAGQLPKDVIAKLGERTGNDFLDQIKHSMAREAFDKSITNGSRNVQLYSNMLRESKIPGASIVAPMVGATVDKYGRQMAVGAVDTAKRLNAIYESEGVQALKREVQPLLDAAKRGNPAAILTFQLMSQSNPQALKHLDDEGQK